jgi:predicted amidohydrolase YtcJ
MEEEVMGSDSSAHHHETPQANNLLLGMGVTATAILMLVCASLLAPDQRPEKSGYSHHGPTTILHNAKIVSADKTLKSTAIVISHGRIVALLRKESVEKWTSSETTLVDLKGAVVIPGLRDAHGHIAGLGKHKESLDLGDAEDLFDLCNRVESHLVTFKGAWLVARGWDRSKWTDQTGDMTRSTLDNYTRDLPVVLRRVDGHAAWVNSKAMEIAGITPETPDPKGGKIVRDSFGEPTGVLIDNAMDLVTRHVPPATDAEIERRWRKGLNAAAKAGLVAVHDAGVGQRELRILEKIASHEELPIRVYVMLSPGNRKFFKAQLKKGPSLGLYHDQVTIRAVKIYQDGALGSRGAALLQDYSDKKGHHGLMVNSIEDTMRLSKMAADAGFQVCTHAIGDAAIRAVLDNYGEIYGDNGYKSLKNARHRIEHAQVIDVHDLPRFSEMGVIPSMQPTHATSDMRWAKKRLGDKRLQGAYAWKTLKDSGCVLAFGSDFPVEPEHPLEGIYAAITRKNPGRKSEAWRTAEALSPGAALEAFTYGPAYAAFEENDRGRILVGQKADLTILSGNPLELGKNEPEKILKLKVIDTYVNGRKVKPLPAVAPKHGHSH